MANDLFDCSVLRKKGKTSKIGEKNCIKTGVMEHPPYTDFHVQMISVLTRLQCTYYNNDLLSDLLEIGIFSRNV